MQAIGRCLVSRQEGRRVEDRCSVFQVVGRRLKSETHVGGKLVKDRC